MSTNYKGYYEGILKNGRYLICFNGEISRDKIVPNDGPLKATSDLETAVQESMRYAQTILIVLKKDFKKRGDYYVSDKEVTSYTIERLS